MLKATLSSRKFRPRVLAIAAVVMPVVAAGLLTAPSAHADQVWYQSVERSSSASICQLSSVTDIAIGWNNWSGSWEQWANGGRGGWTCTRNLIWARNSIEPIPISGAGCVLANQQNVTYADFGSGDFLASNAPVYSDSRCTTTNSFYIPQLVYATTYAAADAICIARVTGTNASIQSWTATNIYTCVM